MSTILPTVLFRKALQEEGELDVCKKYFPTVELRSQCPPDSLIVGRYSCLPYYNELEKDLESIGSRLINSYRQHQWIANFEYYQELKEYTPETWFDDNFHQCNHPGPFVVKGKTNSRKLAWNKMMFAETKKEALNIASELLQDALIAEQGIIYRKYVPLKLFERGLCGLPFSNEWRFFYYKTNLLTHGYYWSSAENVNHTIDVKGISFAETIAKIVSNHVNFFVLDIAETDKGDWILIEINDAQMSGLSENEPKNLYHNLKQCFMQEAKK